MEAPLRLVQDPRYVPMVVWPGYPRLGTCFSKLLVICSSALCFCIKVDELLELLKTLYPDSGVLLSFLIRLRSDQCMQSAPATNIVKQSASEIVLLWDVYILFDTHGRIYVLSLVLDRKSYVCPHRWEVQSGGCSAPVNWTSGTPRRSRLQWHAWQVYLHLKRNWLVSSSPVALFAWRYVRRVVYHSPAIIDKQRWFTKC